MFDAIANACQTISVLDDVVTLLEGYNDFGHVDALTKFFTLRLPNGELACNFVGYKEAGEALCKHLESQLPEGYWLKRNQFGNYAIQEVWEDDIEANGLADLKVDLVFKEIGNDESDFGSIRLVGQTVNMNIARIRVTAQQMLTGPLRTKLWNLVTTAKGVSEALQKFGFADKSEYDYFDGE